MKTPTVDKNVLFEKRITHIQIVGVRPNNPLQISFSDKTLVTLTPSEINEMQKKGKVSEYNYRMLFVPMAVYQ